MSVKRKFISKISSVFLGAVLLGAVGYSLLSYNVTTGDRAGLDEFDLLGRCIQSRLHSEDSYPEYCDIYMDVLKDEKAFQDLLEADIKGMCKVVNSALVKGAVKDSRKQPQKCNRFKLRGM